MPIRPIHAQKIDSIGLIRKADFRGQPPRSAIVASLSASNQDVIVVLMRGGGKLLSDEIEGQLKALVHNGYERIGLVLGDESPDEHDPVIYVFSDGTVYAVVKDVRADSVTSWKIYNLVRDAYRENIWPKMNKPSGKDPKPD